jgi:hypothetical protein
MAELTQETRDELAVVESALLGYVAALWAQSLPRCEDRDELVAMLRDHQMLVARANRERSTEAG